MTDSIQPIASPWQVLWDGRLRRSSALVLAALVFAAGFHFVFMDTLNLWEMAAQAAVMEIGVVMAGNPNGPAPSLATLQWMRGVGLRLFAWGTVATAAASAVIVTLTPPVARSLIVALLVPFALGGFAILFGASLIYWSSPRVRRWSRNSKPQPLLILVIDGGMILAACYSVISRVQLTGHWEPLRLTGLGLVVAALGIFTINAPSWRAEQTA